jgi:hypothetical protein
VVLLAKFNSQVGHEPCWFFHPSLDCSHANHLWLSQCVGNRLCAFSNWPCTIDLPSTSFTSLRVFTVSTSPWPATNHCERFREERDEATMYVKTPAILVSTLWLQLYMRNRVRWLDFGAESFTSTLRMDNAVQCSQIIRVLLCAWVLAIWLVMGFLVLGSNS